MKQPDFDGYMARPTQRAKDDDLTTDQINEALHVLTELYFGTDHNGRNALVRLQRQMRHYRIDFDQGIKKWRQWMEDFQSYIPLMPWEAGARMGEKPVPFTNMEMRTILDGALHHLYQAELVMIEQLLSNLRITREE